MSSKDSQNTLTMSEGKEKVENNPNSENDDKSVRKKNVGENKNSLAKINCNEGKAGDRHPKLGSSSRENLGLQIKCIKAEIG